MRNREQTFVEGRQTPEPDPILQQRINELGLKVEGSVLEVLIRELEYELLKAGFTHVKPRCYLSDEWGCPEGVPIIGIPFYLADERLKRAAAEVVENENEAEILGYLRHEMGHVVNYAYRLYTREDWTAMFGPYSRPYVEHYLPVPFSRDYVRHIAGWYAQKHPDEDFAETFAVWLTPGSDWRTRYGGGALKKLEYVDRLMQEIGPLAPPVPQPAPEPRTGEIVAAPDEDPVESFTHTVQEHIDRYKEPPVEVPPFFDGDLRDLFDGRSERPDVEPAADFLARHRRRIVKRVSHWTGVREGIVGSLIDHLIERARALSLLAERRRTSRRLIDIISYVTTLSMNFLYKGTFIPGTPPPADVTAPGPATAKPPASPGPEAACAPFRVTILYDVAEDHWFEDVKKAAATTGEPLDPPVHHALGEALASRGHKVKKLAAQPDALGLAEALSKDKSDVVFNICDGLGGVTARAMQVVALMELFGKRFTGSGSEAMAIAQDKVLSKQLFAHYGVPSPRFAVLDRAHLEWVEDLRFPLIVKPSNEDASIGIDDASVVTDVRGLLERVSYIHTEIGRPALIEEYVEGREIYAVVLGNNPPEVLPLLEWPLKGEPGHRIATYAAKWDPKHPDFQEVADHFATDLAPEVVERIERAAVKAYRALRLEDYARMDIRLAADGTPFFLEVNANAFLDPLAEVAMAARAKGLYYPELAERIMALALERYPAPARKKRAEGDAAKRTRAKKAKPRGAGKRGRATEADVDV